MIRAEGFIPRRSCSKVCAIASERAENRGVGETESFSSD